MARPVTLFTGQWADLPLEELARKASEFGFDGLELACWGDHFEVDKALTDDDYCAASANCWTSTTCRSFAISNHLVGQAVLDDIDARHKAIVPPYVWGDGDPDGVNRAGRRGDEEHGPGRAEAGRRRGQRLHRLEHLAAVLFLPAGARRR